MSLVPVYHGYKKRELLREDDRIVRGHVADVLREASKNLQLAAEEATRRLGPQAWSIMQQPNNPIELLSSRGRRVYSIAGLVEHLEVGYSPGWSRVRVKEEDLEKLIEIDNEMIGYSHVVLETSKQVLNQVRSQGWFDTRLIVTLNESIDSIERIVEERRRFLHGSAEIAAEENKA